MPMTTTAPIRKTIPSIGRGSGAEAFAGIRFSAGYGMAASHSPMKVPRKPCAGRILAPFAADAGLSRRALGISYLDRDRLWRCDPFDSQYFCRPPTPSPNTDRTRWLYALDGDQRFCHHGNIDVDGFGNKGGLKLSFIAGCRYSVANENRFPVDGNASGEPR
jgi:hypothetical protein